MIATPAESLSAKVIMDRLRTTRMGRRLEVHAEIDSTNTRAVALARAGAPEGTLVLAEVQTAGRGRLGRRWQSPPGSALLASLLLRPPLPPIRAQWGTMICTLAAVEAVAEVTGLAAGIKWPNDLVLAGRKVGGVLTELGAGSGGMLDYVVVGMGLNVNLDPGTLDGVMTPATSLAAESGAPVSRLDLLLAWLRRVESTRRPPAGRRLAPRRVAPPPGDPGTGRAGRHPGGGRRRDRRGRRRGRRPAGAHHIRRVTRHVGRRRDPARAPAVPQ